MAWAFGIDLAGYSAGRSVLAAAKQIGDQAEVVLLDTPVLSTKVKGAQLLASVQDAEVRLLSACLERGRLAVDVPIDLQGLPDCADAREVWQLTQRPADRAYGGLPPLADRIGSTVARFTALTRQLGNRAVLGENLLETYPAASITTCGLSSRGYKGGKCEFHGHAWIGADPANTNDRALADLAGAFSMRSSTPLSDDDLDAAICALTAASSPEHQLSGTTLEADMRANGAPGVAPAGYVLLRSIPWSSVSVSRQSAALWFANCGE